jgi:hypothetical protein
MNADERKEIQFYLRAFACICGFIFLFGCAAHPRPVTKPPYFGETLALQELVGRINENNRKLPTLWSEVATMKASWVDDRGKRHDETLDGGNLIYRSPMDVRVRGDKMVIGNVVEIGSNGEMYWLVAKDPGPDTAWWGRYKYLGDERAQPIPIRPDLVLQVLAVGPIETDLSKLPAPVLRFNHDADAYMLTWTTKLANRWVALKEVWYDRKTLAPMTVLLFDANGRVVLRAWLTKHERVESAELAKEQWPVAASEYRLYFPESKSSMTLKLRNMQVSRKGIPSDKSFAFDRDPRRVGVSKVIQLDEACGP